MEKIIKFIENYEGVLTFAIVRNYALEENVYYVLNNNSELIIDLINKKNKHNKL